MPISRINTNSIANNTIQGADLLDASITAAKIISVANTQITGNITAAQITSVANTQLTGTITGSQISSNTLSNTVFQTGSVENYMSAAGLGFGMRNRIINGAMVIDQRNAGASVTASVANSLTYTLDRWAYYASQASKYTVQQNAGSVTPPVGFTNYLGVTSSSAYSVTSTDEFEIQQRIEGFNLSDLAWGTANAKSITISAWVYSSLTGTFGGSVRNSSVTRSYPFTYSIPVANTWTQISVTIPGDTSGTWVTNNGIGINLNIISLGAGSTNSGTAGAWASANYTSATGAVSVVGTSGATFYITGVQLEKGSTATSFDYRPYGTELLLCQRYYEQDVWATVAVNTNGTNISWSMPFRVTKRTTPTVTNSGTVTFQGIVAGVTVNAPGGTVDRATADASRSGTQGDAYYVTSDSGGWKATAEL